MFIVQGEGRGHMTQALALEQILSKAGHQVTDIIIGTSSRREIPAFFREKTKANLQPIKSPNFYYDGKSKSIRIWKTVLFNLLKTPLYIKDLIKINRLKNAAQPDIIINFYDVLGGFYFLFFRPQTRRICIAHQYLAEYPSFPFAKGLKSQKLMFKINNALTSFACHKKLALSFRNLPHQNSKLRIVPPLLRSEILSLEPCQGDHILAYVVNKGYGEEIIEWHNRNRKIKLHCFWDNKEYPDEWSPNKNLTFHHINDQKFLKLMSTCIGYASTAGFESICEAMYLGKPVLMVPVKGQYEQACNAQDAKLAKAGISARKFKIGLLLNHITKQHEKNSEFKNWMEGYEKAFLTELLQIPQAQESIWDKARIMSNLLSISNK